MICDKCNSEDVQKLSVIFENGTHNINTNSRSTGIGIGSGGSVGVMSGNTNTSGQSQTLLAQKVAPPSKNSSNLYQLSFLIGFILIMFFREMDWKLIAGIIFFAFGMKVYKVTKAYNENVYPEKYNNWLKSWHCNKCGNIYKG